MHRFAGRYAQYYNSRHQRRGYVYQGRFRSIIVENGLYLKRLIRYLHLNPLEAGLAKTPDDYRWSSHQAYFGHAFFTWLETRRVLAYFGTTVNKRGRGLRCAICTHESHIADPGPFHLLN